MDAFTSLSNDELWDLWASAHDEMLFREASNAHRTLSERLARVEDLLRYGEIAGVPGPFLDNLWEAIA